MAYHTPPLLGSEVGGGLPGRKGKSRHMDNIISSHVNNNGANLDLPKKNASKSSIATLRPYNPDSTGAGPKKKNNRNKTKSLNGNQIEILPGVYEDNAYTKFLTFSFENDQSLNELDIFDVHREIVTCIGREPKISQESEGKLLIEVSSPEESNKLQDLNNVTGKKIKCIPHISLNQSRGVIYAPELLKYSEEKLKKELESQKVTEVKRIHKRIDNELVPLPMLILTFDLLNLPNKVHAAWYKFPVRPYIPSPRRCFHCQMYGHLITNCRKKQQDSAGVCVNCGEEEHGACSKPSRCHNCSENHPASDKTCKRYLLEKEVIASKVKERITFKEAKQKYAEQFDQLKSYADALKKKNINTAEKTKISETPLEKSHQSPNEPMESSNNKRDRSSDSIEIPSSKISNSDAGHSPASKQEPASGTPVSGAAQGGPSHGPSTLGGPVPGSSTFRGHPSCPSVPGGSLSDPPATTPSTTSEERGSTPLSKPKKVQNSSANLHINRGGLGSSSITAKKKIKQKTPSIIGKTPPKTKENIADRKTSDKGHSKIN